MVDEEYIGNSYKGKEVASKGPIYLDEGAIGGQALLSQLHNAVEELEHQMKATKPILKGNCKMGFGVDKTQRGIAADSVISIAKAIKALKGW